MRRLVRRNIFVLLAKVNGNYCVYLNDAKNSFRSGRVTWLCTRYVTLLYRGQIGRGGCFLFTICVSTIGVRTAATEVYNQLNGLEIDSLAQGKAW